VRKREDGWGGRREGSGRKRVESGRRVQRSIRLTVGQWERLDAEAVARGISVSCVLGFLADGFLGPAR
jgi:hypothetical protein